MLNDKRITVRMNCEYVLRQAYWHNREGYIWVDALCINQDNVAEKNVQVAMMGDIFKSARRVLACVGPLADDSKYLLCIIRDNSQCYTFIADIYDTLIADVTDPDYRWKYIEEYNLRTGLTPRNMDSHICRWLLQWFPLGFARVARAHNHFFRRPYFNRIWILQELFLAKDIVICCGNDQLPFRLLPGHLVMMLWLVKLRRTSVRISWKYLKLTKPRRMILMRLISRGIGVRDDDDPIGDSLPIDVGRKGSDRLLTVHEYLTRFQGECQDPRDMIYATLSMIDWCGNTQMHPDYGKSCFQLALEVLAHVDSNADLFNETLSEWLVKNLQLHREREVEIRVSTMSILGPDPPAPRQAQTLARRKIQGRGFTLTSQTSQPGLYLRGFMGEFIGPILETVNAQEGDIVIRLIALDNGFNRMIVARQRSKGRLSLIGLTALFEPPILGGPRDDILTYFDPEDLLMLRILDESLDQLLRVPGMRVTGNKAIFQLLSRRVCRFEGSSYAVWNKQSDSHKRSMNVPSWD